MNVESLKKYIKELSQKEYIKLINDIYKVCNISIDYPSHKHWFYTKQIPGIFKGERDILFIRNPKNKNEIIAFSCLKKTETEKKICNIYVSEEFRNKGLGTILFEESMKWLGTTKPLITFADYKLYLFEPFIKKYKWNLIETIEGIYNSHSKELCYNDTLSKEKYKDNYKRLIKVLNQRINQLSREEE